MQEAEQKQELAADFYLRLVIYRFNFAAYFLLLLLFIYVAGVILTVITASPPGAPKTKLILKSKVGIHSL